LNKRKTEIKNKYIELESNIIYSGECFFPFELQVISANNIFSLFNGYIYENRHLRKIFLKFQTKEMTGESGQELKLPSMVTRSMTFSALRRKNLIDIVPYMLNVVVQFVVGSNIIETFEGRHILADNNQHIGDKFYWGTIARMPMETTAVFKVNIYSKEGDGIVVGVGAMKLYDENGYLLQGEQEVHLYAK
jgi:hypothetical protein